MGYLTLQKLDLSGNSIDIEGVRALGSFIIQSAIQDLSFANNFLYVEGTKALIEALIENRSLRKLNLASNFMKDDGCQMLCFYLGLPTCMLIELNLQDNFITDKSASVLIEVLDPTVMNDLNERSDSMSACKNQFLASIDLRQNGINGVLLSCLANKRPGI